MSIAKFSIANRLTEQVIEQKRRSSALLRTGHTENVPFDTADSGLYPANQSDNENEEDDGVGHQYENELELRIDTFDDHNVKL